MCTKILRSMVREPGAFLSSALPSRTLGISLLVGVAVVIAYRLSCRIPFWIPNACLNYFSKPKVVPQLGSSQTVINRIAAAVFEKFSQQKSIKNFSFFTPALIPNLLMLYAIAPADLKQVFEKEFRITGKDRIHKDCKSWLHYLASHRQGEPTIKAAQAVAIKEGLQIQPEPSKIYEGYGVEMLPFEDTKEAETQGNQWVEKETEGAIKDLIQISNPSTVFVMITAALFKGSWLYPFEKEKTTQEIFTNGDGSLVMIKQMQMKADEFRTGFFQEDIRVLELPFRGSISMVFFLPKVQYEGKVDSKVQAETAVQKLSTRLTADLVSKFLTNPISLKKRKSLTIGIPRLHLNHQTNLMEDLGSWPLMKKIAKADLRPSFSSDAPTLNVEKIMMQTNMTVDEEGAQIRAAAYTPVFVDSCPPQPFRINGPFAYAFFDKETQTILGMGRVTQLEGEAPDEEFLRIFREERWA